MNTMLMLHLWIFPGRRIIRKTAEDQPMNPDDVQASEEVGDDEAIPEKNTSVSNTADTQRNSRKRVDASASSIVV